MVKSAKKMSIKDLCLISLFVALITVCSWVSIPLAVPVTMQVFAVFLSCAYLGLSKGVLCVSAYILLGAVGVPVFSNFRGGISHLFTVSGGFIIGFLFSAVIIGFMLKKKENSFKFMLFSMTIALFICYVVGSAWILILTTDNLNTNLVLNLLVGLIPLLLMDLIKVFMAAFLAVKLKKIGDTAIK